MREEIIKKIIQYLKENLTIGEAYERGDVYLDINEVRTISSGGDLKWDNEFWEELEKDMLKNIQ